MRTFSKYGSSEDAYRLLDMLSSNDTSVADYCDAFEGLGEILGRSLLHTQEYVGARMMLACAAEDADWLATGVMRGLQREDMPIAVFWNDRVSIATLPDGNKVEISPIVKSYEDECEACDTLIIVKSIISTSCVVKTQLMRLLDSKQPTKIVVMAPVMFKDSDKHLRSEFPEDVAQKMEFFTLATDDERDGNVVIPGVGGMVYPRLGLGDAKQKNGYMPNLVWSRMI